MGPKTCGCHYDLNTQELKHLCPVGNSLMDSLLDANVLVLEAERAGCLGIEMLQIQERSVRTYQQHTGVITG